MAPQTSPPFSRAALVISFANVTSAVAAFTEHGYCLRRQTPNVFCERQDTKIGVPSGTMSKSSITSGMDILMQPCEAAVPSE